MYVFSSTSQIMSQCGKDRKNVNKEQPCVSMMFLPHFDFLLWSTTKKIFDNIENIRLNILKEQKVANVDIICASVHQYIIRVNQKKFIIQLTIILKIYTFAD